MPKLRGTHFSNWVGGGKIWAFRVWDRDLLGFLLEERERVWGVLERWVLLLSRVCGVGGVDGGVGLGEERE